MAWGKGRMKHVGKSSIRSARTRSPLGTNAPIDIIVHGSVGLTREEQPVIALVLGSACLSLIVFILCATHLYYRGLVLAICLLAILIAWRFKPAKAEPFPPFDKFERFLLLFFIPFATIYLINAMAPETSPDGSTYHLGIIADYARAHGFLPLHTTIYASLSQESNCCTSSRSPSDATQRRRSCISFSLPQRLGS